MLLDSAYINGFLGGTLVGLSSLLLLIGSGRIAGISGIAAGVLSVKRGDMAWRVLFIAGLWLGAVVFMLLTQAPLTIQIDSHWYVIAAGGFLVGLGTRIGGGCTSGHGICGNARLSGRSHLATILFICSGIITVFVSRHIFNI